MTQQSRDDPAHGALSVSLKIEDPDAPSITPLSESARRDNNLSYNLNRSLRRRLQPRILSAFSYGRSQAGGPSANAGGMRYPSNRPTYHVCFHVLPEGILRKDIRSSSLAREGTACWVGKAEAARWAEAAAARMRIYAAVDDGVKKKRNKAYIFRTWKRGCAACALGEPLRGPSAAASFSPREICAARADDARRLATDKIRHRRKTQLALESRHSCAGNATLSSIRFGRMIEGKLARQGGSVTCARDLGARLTDCTLRAIHAARTSARDAPVSTTPFRSFCCMSPAPQRPCRPPGASPCLRVRAPPYSPR